VKQLTRTLTEGEMRDLLLQAGRDCSAVGDRACGNPNSRRESFRRYRLVRNLALVDLLFATGMRVGEVSALDVHDFLVRDAVFRVQGKGGRSRLAFAVDAETLRIQEQHVDARARMEAKSPALSLNDGGRSPLTRGT